MDSGYIGKKISQAEETVAKETVEIEEEIIRDHTDEQEARIQQEKDYEKQELEIDDHFIRHWLAVGKLLQSRNEREDTEVRSKP